MKLSVTAIIYPRWTATEPMRDLEHSESEYCHLLAVCLPDLVPLPPPLTPPALRLPSLMSFSVQAFLIIIGNLLSVTNVETCLYSMVVINQFNSVLYILIQNEIYELLFYCFSHFEFCQFRIQTTDRHTNRLQTESDA